MFQFNHNHQGAYYLSFAKVIVVKIHHSVWSGGVAAYFIRPVFGACVVHCSE